MKIRFGHINKLISISVQFSGEQECFNGVNVKYKNQEIEILNQFSSIKSFEKLVDEIDINLPVLLHFEGKGILNKKFNRNTNYHQEVVLNGNTDEFYFTDYVEEDTVYTSVVRRAMVQNILERLKKEKVFVVGVSSGPFIVMSIYEYLKTDDLQTSFYKLTVKNEQLSKYNGTDSHESRLYKIGSKSVENTAISALAHAALFFQPSSKIILPKKSEELKDNIEESNQKVLFKQFGFSLMTFFLIALFANFLYLKHLNRKHQSNVILLAKHTETFSQISNLEEEKTRKETLLRTSGILTKKYISFYLATVSNSAPKEVTFTEFIVKPTKEEVKNKYKIEVDNQQLTIKGMTKSSQYLSEWITDLQAFDWIRKVEIEEYAYKKGFGTFYLKIII